MLHSKRNYVVLVSMTCHAIGLDFLIDSGILAHSSDEVRQADLSLTKPITEPKEIPAAQEDHDEKVNVAAIIDQEKRGKNFQPKK